MHTPSHALPEPVDMVATGKKSKKAATAFHGMRGSIETVYPDNDAEAWSYVDERFETHTLTPPAHDYEEWLRTRYEPSDEFSQKLTARLFALWREMDRAGFNANGMELFPHQKALFAWTTLSVCSGTRDRVSNLLLRSPYGSGKTLVGGVTVEAFVALQHEMMQNGTDPKQVPTGAILGMRKEHMSQNALGQQHAVLQPPYTVERKDVTGYWNNLGTMFGTDFSECFEKPRGKKHPFFGLFDANEVSAEEQDGRTAEQKLDAYLAALSGKPADRWAKLQAEKRTQIRATLLSLMAGKMVLVRDIYNVPQPEKPLPREALGNDDGQNRYRGDGAYALVETPEYRIKASHVQLSVNRDAYSNKPNLETPAQFCISYGSALTRAADLVRSDVREEILKRARLLVVDEAGKLNPASLGDTTSELSGEWPLIVGLTGQDRGIDGWSERSPMLSTQEMIRRKLMKPIAFAGIGDAKNPPAAGSEEAWQAYEKQLFAKTKTATKLGLPQPYELDTVVVTASGQAREYAHRIQEAHVKQKMPAKVWCYDGAAGGDRWNIIVNGFNAPKEEGEPKRVLVTIPPLIAEALRLRAECYDILTNMNRYALDQTRGRLGHIRNTEEGANADKARTFFRMQWLQGQQGESYIREMAQAMGFRLPEQDATWTPLQCMIDLDAYERDQKRAGLSRPEPIPDAILVQKRKRRKHALDEGTPLKSTSAFVLEAERKKAERESQSALSQHLAVSGEKEGTMPVVTTKVEAVTPKESGKGKKGKETKNAVKAIELQLDAAGRPVNLDVLAVQCGIHQYVGSLKLAANDAYNAKKRDQELATAILKEINRLCAVMARRGNALAKAYADSAAELEMNIK